MNMYCYGICPSSSAEGSATPPRSPTGSASASAASESTTISKLRSLPTCSKLPGALGSGCLGLGEAISREQVLRSHIEDLSLLETGRDHSLRRLDAEVEGINGTEDLVDRAHLRLVLEVHSPVELGESGHVCALDDEVVLRFVEEGAVGDDVGGRTLIEPSSVIIERPAAATATSSASPAPAVTEGPASLEATASGFLELLAHMVRLYSTVCGVRILAQCDGHSYR